MGVFSIDVNFAEAIEGPLLDEIDDEEHGSSEESQGSACENV